MLDEATASIDSYTEMLIQKALVKLLEGRTGLVIAHRLATIRNADRIIVLQNGEMIESGTHDQLMATRGLYARLYNMNYASFDDLAGQRRRARRRDDLSGQRTRYSSRTAAIGSAPWPGRSGARTRPPSCQNGLSTRSNCIGAGDRLQLEEDRGGGGEREMQARRGQHRRAPGMGVDDFAGRVDLARRSPGSR